MSSSAWAQTSRAWSSFSSYFFVMLSSIVRPSRGSNTFVSGRSLLLDSVHISFRSSVKADSSSKRSFSARINKMCGQVILKALKTFFKICINYKKQNCFNRSATCAIRKFEKINQQFIEIIDMIEFLTHLHCIYKE